ncbi:von Willebrand factor A domain-containing protein 2-like [Globicephala melas]|uniref:von Willebrand factor A domain-containing protein 2-like n=1 Tax=Globicephala melas TaxID=9731 RepID=UPI00293D93E0|nr:uncharacterized protein LOC132593621 [Globicephala melas]
MSALHLSAVVAPGRLSGKSAFRAKRTWRAPPPGSPLSAPGEPAGFLGGSAQRARERPLSWVPGSGAPSGGARTAVPPSLPLQEVHVSKQTIGKISVASKRMWCSAVADVLFLIDGSHSIGKGSFERSKHFAITVCDALDINPRRVKVGAIQFSSSPRLEFPMDAFSTQQEVKARIKRMVFKWEELRTLASEAREQHVLMAEQVEDAAHGLSSTLGGSATCTIASPVSTCLGTEQGQRLTVLRWIPDVEAVKNAGFFRAGAQAFKGTRRPALSHCPADPQIVPFIRTTFSMAPGQELMTSPSSPFWRARVAFEPAAPWPLGLASAMRSERAQQ